MYLDRAYPGKQKGGTRIAADVATREEHERRLADPDTYRPPCSCGHARPHAHELRERRPRGGAPVRIRRYLCPRCGALWTVLPGFLARHLWWPWESIDAAVQDAPARTSLVPRQTRRRWRARLATSGRLLVQLLVSRLRPELAALAAAAGLDATRRRVVEVLRPRVAGVALAWLAALVHLVVPGVRVM